MIKSRLLLLLFVIISHSCTKKEYNIPPKKNNKTNKTKTTLNQQIQEIAKIYYPEQMNFKGNSILNNSEKEDYQITITNSELIDNNLDSTEEHANKIVSLYYIFLAKNVKSLNIKKITVNIEHKDMKISSFEYLEKDIILILTSDIFEIHNYY